MSDESRRAGAGRGSVGLRTRLAYVGGVSAAMIAALAFAMSRADAFGQPSTPQARQAQYLPAAPPQVQLSADQVQLLQQALNLADTHGFEPGEFAPPPGTEGLLRSSDAGARQAGQAQLTAAVLRYAKAVHVGRLPDAAFLNDWGLRPAPYDPAADFARAVSQDQLKTWLDSLPPPYTGYDSLRQGLVAYREIAARGGWPLVPAGPLLKPGVTDDRVIALRTRLAAEDPMVQPAGGPDYDDALAQAVARAQKRYGLMDDGIVNAATLAALNVPVGRRIDQILANMERWRWLPPVLPTDRVQVNIAAAILSVFHADTPVMSMRAVTGRPGDETPMLQSRIESIVFNPPWNVPSTIAAKELWPKQRANPGYFAAHDFVVVPTGDGGTRLQQRAGSMSALGKVKFDFANPYGVYLHDTPSRGLFSRYGRLASHGCVRLQKPLELAKLLLQGDPTWTPDVIDSSIAAGKTVRAPLAQSIAVYLFYWTAYVGPDGAVNFREDPYGWDGVMADKLKAADASGSAGV